MDDKNQKTFADIFSSSSSGKGNGSISFDDIASKVDDSKLSNTTQNEINGGGITFDNLFDKVSLNDENNSKVDDDSAFTDIVNNEVIDTDKKSDISIGKAISFDNVENIFETKGEPLNSQNDNVFFQDYGSNDGEKNNDSASFSELSSDKQIDVDNLDNPFFSTSFNEETISNEDNSQVEVGTQNIQNNVFFAESSDGGEESSGSDIIDTSNSLSNPFFEEVKVEDTSLTEAKNIFQDDFSGINNQENQDIYNNADVGIKNEILKNEESLKEEVISEPVSTSPFFEVDANDDNSGDSSLFLNKINLIENETKDKEVGKIDLSKSKHYNVKVVKKKEPLIKFILGVISYAIFIWLLLIGITLLIYVADIKIRAAKGDYSSPTFNAYVVLTGSMLPEIQIYDVVVTKKVDASTLEIGDIITFSSADSRYAGTTITHRIIKKTYDSETGTYSFQTKGDYNNVADAAPVPEANIYGKVILKIPKLGYLQEFLASDGGWIIVILIPCLTVISYDVVKLIKGLRRKKYKKIKIQK